MRLLDRLFRSSTFVLSMVMVFVVLYFLNAFAQQPVPTAHEATAGWWDWVMGHQSALALVIYAVLDLIIIINPKADGNGILHQVFLWAGKLAGMTPPPVS